MAELRRFTAGWPCTAHGATTRQMPPNEKGFVGYETVWAPFQKEVEYKTPKQP